MGDDVPIDTALILSSIDPNPQVQPQTGGMRDRITGLLSGATICGFVCDIEPVFVLKGILHNAIGNIGRVALHSSFHIDACVPIDGLALPSRYLQPAS